MDTFSEEYKSQVLEVITSMIPQWKGLQPKEFKMERLTGITNQTYKVSHPGAPEPIIYRKFGDADNNVFLDRDAEKFVYQHISEQKLGPKIYGYAPMIRLQSFIVSKVLKTQQMLEKDFVHRVAFALRRFHQMKPLQSIDKRSLFQRIYFENPNTIIEKCFNKLNQNIFEERQRENIQILKKWVSKEEIQFLREATKGLEADQLVFSHNDLLANNILLRENDGKTIFIDYEYSCFNYRVFDIANYFNEAQINYDVDVEPYFGVINTNEQKEKMKDDFIKFYCAGHGMKYPEFKQQIQKGLQLNEEQQKLYERIKSQLPLGEMLSNVMWGWWAIIVCKNPDINFDYIEFAMKRYRDYMKTKQSSLWKI